MDSKKKHPVSRKLIVALSVNWNYTSPSESALKSVESTMNRVTLNDIEEF